MPSHQLPPNIHPRATDGPSDQEFKSDTNPVRLAGGGHRVTSTTRPHPSHPLAQQFSEEQVNDSNDDDEEEEEEEVRPQEDDNIENDEEGATDSASNDSLSPTVSPSPEPPQSLRHKQPSNPHSRIFIPQPPHLNTHLQPPPIPSPDENMEGGFLEEEEDDFLPSSQPPEGDAMTDNAVLNATTSPDPPDQMDVDGDVSLFPPDDSLAQEIMDRGTAELDEALLNYQMPSPNISTVPPADSTTSISPPPTTVAAFEPNDPSLTTFNFHFRQVRTAIMSNFESHHVDLPFECFDSKWFFQLYPLRNVEYKRWLGAYIHYVGPSHGGYSYRSPKISFRIIAFHQTVVEETIKKIRLQRQQQQQQQPSDSSTASTAPTDAIITWNDYQHELPSNHPLNKCMELPGLETIATGSDLGWGHFIQHPHVTSFLAQVEGEERMHFRVIIQDSLRIPVMTRELGDFIKQPIQGQQGRIATKKWRYTGLDNQGATCYMNSYLQTLFYLPLLRAAVYHIPISPEQMQGLISNCAPGVNAATAAAAASASSSSSSAASSLMALPSANQSLRGPSPAPVAADSSMTTIAAALQILLYEMQSTDLKSIKTKNLTAAFGWTSLDSFQQHDVQEFSRKLLENLEDASKQRTPPLPPVTRFFEGHQEMYIECKKVPFKSTRIEPFLDLSLNVVGHKDLKSSLKDYTSSESMEGQNQYLAKDDKNDFGKQDANKGIRILQFPPVLQLTLKRFTYDPQTDRMKKVDDRFAFEEVMDLSEFEVGEMESNEEMKEDQEQNPGGRRRRHDPSDPPIYYLHSVLIHRGFLNGGHYYAYIKPFLANDQIRYQDSPWFKFDDEQVSICASSTEAIEKTFGGEYKSSVSHLGHTKEITETIDANAYMLIYVRQSVVKNKGFETPIPKQIDSKPDSTTNDMEIEHKSNLSESQPMDEDEKVVAKSLVTNSSPSALPPTPGPIALVSGSTHLTDDPSDLDAFITALTPVEVPLPQHVVDALREAERIKQKQMEEAERKAREFNLTIILEKDLVYHGLKNSNGRGGFAGLGLTAASPTPIDSTHSSIQYKLPRYEFTFQRLDTLREVGAILEKKFDIPFDRQQYWRMKVDRPEFIILQHDFRIDALERESSVNFYQKIRPVLFLRDVARIDQDQRLQELLGRAGHVKLNPERTFDYFPTDLGQRQLLLFKFFDVHTQRLFYLGSTLVHPTMNMNELKGFLVALCKEQGIDLKQRRQHRQRLLELLPHGSGQVGSGAVGVGGIAGGSGDVDDPMVDVSPHVSSSPSVVPDPIINPTPTFLPSKHDSEIMELPRKPFYWSDEDRWRHYQHLNTKQTKQQMNSVSPPTTTPSAESYDPFTLPLLLSLEPTKRRTTCPTERQPLNNNLLNVGKKDKNYSGQIQDYKNMVMASKQQRPAASLDGKVPQFLFQLMDVIDSGACVRNYDWAHIVPIIVLSEQLTCDEQRLWTNRATTTTTPTTTNIALPSSVKTPPTSTSSTSSTTPTTSGQEAATLLQQLTSFGSSDMTCITPLSNHHYFPHAYLTQLRHQVQVEFRPVVLDTDTMEMHLLDASTVPSPDHPLLSLANTPLTLTLQSDHTIRETLTILAQHVTSALPTQVTNSYPMVKAWSHYKLYPCRDGQPNMVNGDITRPHRSNSENGPKYGFDSILAYAFAKENQNANEVMAMENVWYQLEAHRHQGHHQPFILFYELSAIAVPTLHDNWCINLDLVDFEGRVHRAPSPYPGLMKYEPFLVSKQNKLEMFELFDELTKWIRQHQSQLDLSSTSTPTSSHATTTATVTTLPDDATMTDANSVANPRKREHEAKDEAEEAADAQPKKKQRLDDAVTTHPGTITSLDSSSAVASSVPLVAPPLPSYSFHIRLYTPLPLLRQQVDVYTRRVTYHWLMYDSSDPAKSSPLRPYLHAINGVIQNIIRIATSQWFVQMSKRLGAPIETSILTSKQATRFTQSFGDRNKIEDDYAQIVPIPLTCFIRPNDFPEEKKLFIFRFTTITPTPNKSSYAFSPLPPILSYLNEDEATFGDVRQRLAEQLQQPRSAIQLALVHPKFYELLNDETPVDERLRRDLLDTRLTNYVLGLVDHETKHTKSTSDTHIDHGQKNNNPNPTFLHRRTPTTLSLGGTKS